MSLLTLPRQVRIYRCAIFAPGLEQRASNQADRETLRTQGFDILPYVQRLDLYESIFDNTISGSVALLEDIGLIEYLPIIGVEVLALSFAVDNERGEERRFTRTFRITKVGNQTFPRHNFRLYTINFATHEFVQSMAQRISRKFSDVTCEQAVHEILQQDLGVDPKQIITNERTIDKISVVIPYYTPLRAINLFTMLARTADAPHESNFLFFETLEGFHFTSIRKLIQDAGEPLRTFNVDPGRATAHTKVADQVIRNAALRFHQEQTFDLLSDIASGTLRSRLVHIDILARQFAHKEDSRYTETFPKTTHLDKYPVYPNNYDLSVSPNVRQFIIPSNAWLVNSPYLKQKQEPAIEQQLREAVVLRNRQLREIKHLQTLIDLPGQPDLRAGSVVIVNYPSTRALEGQNKTINTPVGTRGTPFHSGKHLVTSVHHILAATGSESFDYRMNIRVCKDSFATSLGR